MLNIFGDQAITLESEDKLSRAEYSKYIARSILKWKNQESLCIALYGPWGSGKTSIINMCLQEIKRKTNNRKAEDRPIIIHFRPWIFSGQEELILNFIQTLRYALGNPDVSQFAQKASQHLEKLEKIINITTYIPKINKITKPLKSVISKSRNAAKFIQKRLDEDLDLQKDKICKELLNLKSLIIIVVDDVDRLTDQEIRQLFQLIKAVANFPNTIYFLAFEQELVQKALESFQTGNESGYLEKIVQLGFEVPNPKPSQLMNILSEGLAKIIKTIPDDETEQDRWNQVRFGSLPELLRNVRDVKRLLNSINFVFPLLRDEINTIDIIVMQTIHIFAPHLYKEIFENRYYLLSDIPKSNNRSLFEEKKEQWVQNLENQIPDSGVDKIKHLLVLIFPELGSVYPDVPWSHAYSGDGDKFNRMCISRYFDYYFSISLPDGEVLQKEAKQVFEKIINKKELSSIFVDYIMDNRISNLLPKIDYLLEDDINEKKIVNLFVALFESGEKIPIRPRGGDFLSIDMVIYGTIDRLLLKFDQSKRGKILISALEVSKQAITIPIGTITYFWREWYPLDDNDERTPESERILSKEDADELKEKILKLIRSRKDSLVFLQSRQLFSILCDWERWTSTEEVKEWVELILNDEKKISKFLSGCGGITSSQVIGRGDHFMKHKFKINPRNIERFTDIEKLKSTCIKLLDRKPKWLTQSNKVVLQAYIDGFDDRDF